jgi:lipid-A-disaccharide synthase
MGHPRIFISVGDVSGDLHGANLVSALKSLAPEAEIVGLGGPKMEAAGMRLLGNTVDFGVIGVAPILGSVGRYLGFLRTARRFVAEWKPQAAVTIDCPGFHFLLARGLRAERIPTLWYIPPQLWAWAAWRVRKLRRRYTAVACVLPQEEAFFRQHRVPVTFVGHPVVDHLRRLEPDADFIRTLRAAPGERVLALLPGSRRQEVASILGRQLQVARALAERHPPCRLVLALAAEEHRAWTEAAVRESGLDVRTVVGKTHEVQSAADLVLVASGTATLETAFYRTPMAVFYNITWLQWNLLGRWLVKTPYLSLPNALAGRRIIPEYMRSNATTAEVVEECARLLVNADLRAQVKADLGEVIRKIEKPGTSENAAREVLRLAGS